MAVSACMLSACGGGLLNDLLNGEMNQSSGLDKSEFLGQWVTPTKNYSVNCDLVGQLYANDNDLQFELTETELTATSEMFSDDLCTKKAGQVTVTYSIVWTSIQIPGRRNVAGIDGQLKTVNLAGQDITEQLRARRKSVYTTAFDVVNGELDVGKTSDAASSNGYPREFDPRKQMVRAN